MKRLLLREFKVLYGTNAEFKQQLENYHRAVNSREWKFFKDAILTVKGLILNDMLSARFTDLEPQEKDIAQKVYFEIIQLLDFFTSPLRWIKKKSRFQRANLQRKQNSKGREK